MDKKTVLGEPVAREMLKGIYSDLCIDISTMDDDDDSKSTEKKIISALMHGRLEYKDEVFKQTLIKPIKVGGKEVSYIEISEPDGAQLREMSKVKKKNDDVGKAMAILGAVTGHGLLAINKLKSRDLMVSVGVVSLFL